MWVVPARISGKIGETRINLCSVELQYRNRKAIREEHGSDTGDDWVGRWSRSSVSGKKGPTPEADTLEMKNQNQTHLLRDEAQLLFTG